MVKTNIKLQVTPEQSAKVQKICFDNGINWFSSKDRISLNLDAPFIYISTIYITYETEKYKFIQHHFKEIDPELFIATNGSCQGTIVRTNGQSFVLSTDELTSIQSTRLPQWDYSSKSKIKISSIFEEYGFEKPDFECKLYDKLDDYILGAYFNPNKQKWTMCRWGVDGRNKQGSYNYALTPILVHKPWYETCKFPILVEENQTATYLLITGHEGYSTKYYDNCTPITDTEIEELKRGF